MGLDQPASELALKATRGILWSLAENLGLQLMQFMVSILLARLLLPDQFGLIGMLSLFIAIAQSILDSGFGSALIQKKDASSLDASSVFYFNLIIGIILTSILWLAAPMISAFYSQPILSPLTRLLSISILINAFRLVPTVLITKQMNFKAMFKINLAAVIASGTVGVSLAYLGFGVWSLAVQTLLDTAIRMFLVWRVSRWKPSVSFSLNSLRTMFSFGSRLLVSGILDTFFNNVYQLFIGKVYSATDLGYYVRAQSMQSLAVQPTGMALARVMFPALIPIQDDKEALKQAYRKTMTTAVFFHFPLMVGLIVTAKPLITLLMTERWAASVPYFQLFCIVGFFWPLHVLNLNILQVTGRSDLFLQLEIIKKILIIVAIFSTYRLGIIAMLVGQLVTSIVAFYINSFYSGKNIDYSITQQIRDIFPIFMISVCMGIGIFLIGGVIDIDLIKLLVQVVLGVGIYLGLNWIFDRKKIVDLFQLTQQLLHPSNQSK